MKLFKFLFLMSMTPFLFQSCGDPEKINQKNPADKKKAPANDSTINFTIKGTITPKGFGLPASDRRSVDAVRKRGGRGSRDRYRRMKKTNYIFGNTSISSKS